MKTNKKHPLLNENKKLEKLLLDMQERGFIEVKEWRNTLDYLELGIAKIMFPIEFHICEESQGKIKVANFKENKTLCAYCGEVVD
jgi:hypothetical protein